MKSINLGRISVVQPDIKRTPAESQGFQEIVSILSPREQSRRCVSAIFGRPLLFL